MGKIVFGANLPRAGYVHTQTARHVGGCWPNRQSAYGFPCNGLVLELVPTMRMRPHLPHLVQIANVSGSSEVSFSQEGDMDDLRHGQLLIYLYGGQKDEISR